MKYIITTILLFISFLAHSNNSKEELRKEVSFNNFKQHIIENNQRSFELENTLKFNAFIELINETGSLYKSQIVSQLALSKLSNIEKVIIFGRLGKKLRVNLKTDKLTNRDQILIASYEKFFPNEIVQEVKNKYSIPKIINELSKHKLGITHDEIRELFQNPVASLPDGYEKNENGVRLYMFCRKNRDYPCMLVMHNNELYPVQNGSLEELWHQPSLGRGRNYTDFNITNGNTPAGIHLINSVMPEANIPLSFGKYRRLILNWIPGETLDNDELTQAFLPKLSHDKYWWMEASIARDAGRSLIRVHGTGRTAKKSNPWYPFVRTAGCIAQRENTYNEVTYNDQRNLLDKMMESMNLDPIFENEEDLFGLIYVFEIDEKNKAVSFEDVLNILNN